jgi:hypothetical protein
LAKLADAASSLRRAGRRRRDERQDCCPRVSRGAPSAASTGRRAGNVLTRE